MFTPRLLHLPGFSILFSRRLIYLESAYYKTDQNGTPQETEAVKEVRNAIGSKAETMSTDLEEVVERAREKLNASEPMPAEDAAALVSSTEAYINQVANSVLEDRTINRTHNGTSWYLDLNDKDLEPIRNMRDRALTSLNEANDRYQQFMRDVETAANETADAEGIYKTFIPALQFSGIALYKTVMGNEDPKTITLSQRRDAEAQLGVLEGQLLPNSEDGLYQMNAILARINNLPSASTPTIQKFSADLRNQIATFEMAFGTVKASAAQARNFVKGLRKLSDANYNGDGNGSQEAQKIIEDARNNYKEINSKSLPPKERPANPAPVVSERASGTSEDSPT